MCAWKDFERIAVEIESNRVIGRVIHDHPDGEAQGAEQSMLSFRIRCQLDRLSLTACACPTCHRGTFVRRAAYKNIAKGLRRFDELLAGSSDQRPDPRTPRGVDVPPQVIKHAIEETHRRMPYPWQGGFHQVGMWP
jgi:hypothetical protein